MVISGLTAIDDFDWRQLKNSHHLVTTDDDCYFIVSHHQLYWWLPMSHLLSTYKFINHLFNLMHYRVSELTVVNEVLRKYIDPEKADAIHKQR